MLQHSVGPVLSVCAHYFDRLHLRHASPDSSHNLHILSLSWNAAVGTKALCCDAGLSAGVDGDPRDVWVRSGCPPVPDWLQGWTAVLLVASMALAGAHWFCANRAQARSHKTFFVVTFGPHMMRNIITQEVALSLQA